MLSRRAVLTTGTASLLITGGLPACFASHTKENFRAPWESARQGFGDIRLNALAYAILAPNPHNRQPWQVVLHDDGLSYDLYCDLDRLLPETDPPNRQVTIGLGAFLELYRQATAEQGYTADITPFPQGEPYPVLDERPVASVTLRENSAVERSPLFQYALARRTVRTRFQTDKPITDADITQLFTLSRLSGTVQCDATIQPDRIRRLQTLCHKGWEIETSTSRTHHESTALIRIGAQEVSAQPDGISLLGGMMEIYHKLGILTREKMNKPGSQAYKGNVNFYAKLIDSVGAFVWLSTPTNSRIDQLNAGANWVRLHLAATQLGLAFHPLSQVLQEFPEMDDMYAQCHTELDIHAPARIQGLFRLGYAPYPKAAPRWPLKSRLMGLAP